MQYIYRVFLILYFSNTILFLTYILQTCVRKIRLNMPILSSDFVKDDEDNVHRNDDDDPEETEEVDPFDKLIGENHSTSLCNKSTSEIFSNISTTNTPSMSDGHRLGSSFGSVNFALYVYF